MRIARLTFNRSVIVRQGLPKHVMSSIFNLLPMDAAIIDFKTDPIMDQVHIYVESTSFKDVTTGSPPEITIWIKQDFMGESYVEKLDFHDIMETSTPQVPKTNSVPVSNTKNPYPCYYHNWVKYTGLQDVYKVCSKCGVKESKP
jgi:hypothetical protein